MRINQEQFNKLPQLDRIEFRQKDSKIRDAFQISSSNQAMIFTLLILTFTVALSGLLRYRGNILASDNLFNILPFIMTICAVYLMFGILIDIFELIMKRKNLNKLEEEYFKVEVKNATKSR